MNIILLNNFCKKKGSIDICMPKATLLMAISFFIVVGLSLSAGYFLGQEASDSEDLASYSKVSSLLESDRLQLLEEKLEVQAHLDALAIRLGSLQSHVLRLDALGDHLVEVAKLDSEEFNFNDEPAIGGLDASDNSTSQDISELIAGVNTFNDLFDDCSQKLDLLDELLANRQLNEEITLSGRPVVKGWLSSHFGHRIDPKTGKKTFHRGRDYAGKEGNSVIAVASGLITRSEYQNGFGNMVEIKHADGYSTIYAHNQENLVEVGATVKKGQKIALLGSTGRSTGPHVHFEVRKNGKYLNPKKVLRK